MNENNTNNLDDKKLKKLIHKFPLISRTFTDLNLEGKLFEHFIVVGLKSDSTPEPNKKYTPEILFQYPKDNKLALSKVENFCFPDGVSVTTIRRTESCSSLNELLFGNDYILGTPHIFLLMGEGMDPMYGICVTKPELLRATPSFFEKQTRLVANQNTYLSAQRCYCLLTKYPFFSLHFDILYGLLGRERLDRFEKKMYEDPKPNRAFGKDPKQILEENKKFMGNQPINPTKYNNPTKYDNRKTDHPSTSTFFAQLTNSFQNWIGSVNNNNKNNPPQRSHSTNTINQNFVLSKNNNHNYGNRPVPVNDPHRKSSPGENTKNDINTKNNTPPPNDKVVPPKIVPNVINNEENKVPTLTETEKPKETPLENKSTQISPRITITTDSPTNDKETVPITYEKTSEKEVSVVREHSESDDSTTKPESTDNESTYDKDENSSENKDEEDNASDLRNDKNESKNERNTLSESSSQQENDNVNKTSQENNNKDVPENNDYKNGENNNNNNKDVNKNNNITNKDKIENNTNSNLEVKKEEPVVPENKIITILKSYQSQKLPKKGETCEFNLLENQRTFTYTVPPKNTERRILRDYCMSCLFRSLSITNIIHLYSAILQEKSVVFISPDLSKLSAIILSIIGLLYPFVWQGLIIPVLPNVLHHVVYAPVPYILGVQSLDEKLRQNVNGMIVLVEQNRIIQNIKISVLPAEKKLSNNLFHHHKSLQSDNKQGAFMCSNEQLTPLRNSLQCFSDYNFWLCSKILQHFINDMSIVNSASMKKSFSRTVSQVNQDWIENFLSTQLFAGWIDPFFKERLERLEKEKNKK